MEETGEHYLDISWQADGHTQFSVPYRSDNLLDHGQNQTVAEGRIKLAGLSPGTEYNVKVAAITESGSTYDTILEFYLKYCIFYI